MAHLRFSGVFIIYQIGFVTSLNGEIVSPQLNRDIIVMLTARRKIYLRLHHIKPYRIHLYGWKRKQFVLC